MLVALGSCLTAGVAAVAQHREIQLRKVTATVEGDMNVLGILGADPEVRNGFRDIRVRFDIDADASPEDIKALVAQSQKRSAVFDVDHQSDQRRRRRRLSDGGAPMQLPVVVIGAGHAGLAMSRRLTERSIDHVVLERGEVANSWRTERWDSLRLLTPNWHARLPGAAAAGDDPDGFMTVRRGRRAHRAATPRTVDAPVVDRTTVIRLGRRGDGYEVVTDRGVWTCAAAVIASGAAAWRACRRSRPRCRPSVTSVTPLDLPQSRVAARRRRARRRRVGHRRPARRGDPAPRAVR